MLVAFTDKMFVLKLNIISKLYSMDFQLSRSNRYVETVCYHKIIEK